MMEPSSIEESKYWGTTSLFHIEGGESVEKSKYQGMIDFSASCPNIMFSICMCDH